MRDNPIKFRPHHFMCMIGFQGMGYSPSLVENYNKIVSSLQAKPESLIQIVAKEDIICNA